MTTRKDQLRVFDTVLSEAQPRRHLLTVHSRGAAQEVVSVLARVWELPAYPAANLPSEINILMNRTASGSALRQE